MSEESQSRTQRLPTRMDFMISIQLMMMALVVHMWFLDLGYGNEHAKAPVSLLMFAGVVYYFNRPFGGMLDDLVGAVRGGRSE